jgi:hypothetical protein
MRARWMASLGLMVGVWLAGAAAEDVNWRPAVPVANSGPAPTPAVAPSFVVNLGQPISSAQRNPDGLPAAPVGPVINAVYPANTIASSRPQDSPSGLVQTQASGIAPPPAPPADTAIAPVQVAPVAPVPPMPPDFPPSGGPPPGTPGGHPGFWDKCKLECGNWDGSGRHWLQSDHAFDAIISPVSSPFLNEDPRSLTEIRPIFLFQTIPSSTPNVHGGNIEFFGTQARVAFTDRLSLVMSEIGGIWTNPDDHTYITNASGMSELRIGPKYTFLRDEDHNTVGAFGLTFDCPTGSSAVFQNTGALSIAPYLTMAHKFEPTSYGHLDLQGTIGYNFSVNEERSDFFYTSLHLDYDIAGWNLYPLIELNYIHYGKSGNGPPLGFEGGDLFNFGSSNSAGENDLTMAIGARYKIYESAQCGSAQVGFALEFPLCASQDLNNFRLTLDFILRY